MSLYSILTDYLTRPVIEKNQGVGYARGYVRRLLELHGENGSRESIEEWPNVFARTLARGYVKRLAKVQQKDFSPDTVKTLAKSFTEGFAEGCVLEFDKVCRAGETGGSGEDWDDFFSESLPLLRIESRRAGFAEAFDKGVGRGHKQVKRAREKAQKRR